MSEASRPVPAVIERTRERTVELLCTHFAEDRIDLAEFERRVDLAHRASSAAELDVLLSDLPGGEPARAAPTKAVPAQAPASAPPTPATPRRDRQLVAAILGGTARKGQWAPARSTMVFTFMGGAELDFREANLPPGVTEVVVFAFMGGVEIIAPPGLALEVGGLAIMGGIDHVELAGTPENPDAPILKVNGFVCMGGVEVSVRLPGESARDAKRRLRAERKRLR